MNERSLLAARRRGLLSLLLALLVAGQWCVLPPARAQDEPPAAPAEQPADEPIANPANNANEAAAPAPINSAAPEGSTLWWYIESSGFIGLVILLLSIYFIATVSRLFIELRQKVATPPVLVDELVDLLQKREFKEIYARVKDDPSFLGRLLSAGISELPNGLADGREALERTGEAITVELERKISMLAVLGTLGPMIGLLGTLKGMIAAFSIIARSDVQLKASEVAGAISEALLLTFEGVALSVPAIYFYALFRNRVSSISASTHLQADEFLRHFARAARSKTAQPVAAKPVNP